MARTRSVKTWQELVPFSEQLLDLHVKEGETKKLFPSLMKVSSHWYAVGVALGIPVNKLDEIRSNRHDGSLAMLAQMLHYWIHNTASPTWRSMIEALHTLGYKTAVSAVITAAERIILEHCESSEMPQRYDSVEAKESIVSADKFKFEIMAAEKREKKLIEELGEILYYPTLGADSESLLSNIIQHILTRSSLTRDEVKEVTFIMKYICGEFRQHSIILEDHIQVLDEYLRGKGRTRTELITLRQKLQQQMSRLNEEIKDIKSAYVQEPDYSSTKLEKLKSMAQKEIILHDVGGQLEKCVSELQCVNDSYQALSQSLHECEGKLQETLQQSKQLREISTSCKTLNKIFFQSSPFFHVLGLSVIFILIEATFHHHMVDFFSFVTMYCSVCVFIMVAGGYFLKYISQSPLQPSESAVHQICRWGGISLVILVVAYPTSTVFLLMHSMLVGFSSALIFSSQYRPIAPILSHRLGVFTAIYTWTEFIASLFNNPDNEVSFFPFIVSLLMGLVFEFLSAMLMLQFDNIKSCQMKTPLQWDIGCVAVGVLASFFIKFAPAGDAYRLPSALGTSVGAYLGLTCFDEKIFFSPPPEDDVFDDYAERFRLDSMSLSSTSRKCRSLQTEIDRFQQVN